MRQSFNIVGYGCFHLSPFSRLVVASLMICSVDWKLIIYYLLLKLLSFTLNYYFSRLEITSGYKSKAALRNTQARADVKMESFSLWRACGIISNSHWKVIRNQMNYCGGAFNKKKNPQPVFKNRVLWANGCSFDHCLSQALKEDLSVLQVAAISSAGVGAFSKSLYIKTAESGGFW